MCTRSSAALGVLELASTKIRLQYYGSSRAAMQKGSALRAPSDFRLLKCENSYCTVSCVVPAMEPDVAVIVVVPVEIAVTKPLVEIEATEVLLEDHETELVTSPVVPSENVAVAVNCCAEPLLMMAFDGLIVMLVMVLLLTVNRVVAITLPDFAWMVVPPSVVVAVAKPPASMVAMLVEVEVQVTWFVASPLVPLPKVAVAAYCWVVLCLMVALTGEIVSAVMVSAPGKNCPQPARIPVTRSPRRRKAKKAIRLQKAGRCTRNMLSPSSLQALDAVQSTRSCRQPA